MILLLCRWVSTLYEYFELVKSKESSNFAVDVFNTVAIALGQACN